MIRPNRAASHGLGYARVVAFLLGSAALIIFVAYYYLFPALEAAGSATAPQKRILSAHSRLLLALLLFIVLMGLLLTFRVGRFFFPRKREKPKPTVYPDAWAESARRIDVTDDEP